MMPDRFHIQRDGATLTLTRRRPARMDFHASTRFPLMSRERLAQVIRQDLWRALRNLRGFSPVIRITRHTDHLSVQAGGQVSGAIPDTARQIAQAVLDDPAHRQRWAR